MIIKTTMTITFPLGSKKETKLEVPAKQRGISADELVQKNSH